jgi:5-methylcytosine-specific restriction endonuclease McrA
MPTAYDLPLPGEPIPAQFKLGNICKRGHDWTSKGQSLRYNKPRAGCVLCERQNAIKRQERRKQEDPDFLAKQAASARKRRAQPGYVRSDRSAKHNIEWHEARMLMAAIKRAGRLPSVAILVRDLQRKYWREHPAEYKEFVNQRNLRAHQWRYMTDHSFRLYHRSKSKQRKAKQRGSTALMLSRDQLWRRWVEFDHCCAYCGIDGDMHIEHVIPISKGGEHHLGNIVPACQRCNYSKNSAPVEQWYKAQPFFSDAKWQKIQDILVKSMPMTEQLAMPLPPLTGPS